LGRAGAILTTPYYESLPRKGQLRGSSDGAILRRPLQKKSRHNSSDVAGKLIREEGKTLHEFVAIWVPIF
jgi:hypothetical protein